MLGQLWQPTDVCRGKFLKKIYCMYSKNQLKDYEPKRVLTNQIQKEVY